MDSLLIPLGGGIFMSSRFFNSENSFFTPFSKVADVMGLSILWLVSCIPVITIGPATAALYYTAVKGIRRGNGGIWSKFFQSFWGNFKTGLIVWGILGVTASLCLWGSGVLAELSNQGSRSAAVGAFGAFALFLVLTAMIFYAFPLLSRFEFGLGVLLLTALQLVWRNLLTTLYLILVVVAAWLSLRLIIPIFFAPAGVALLWSFVLERVFKRYTPAPEGMTEDLPWYLQ